jgi:hypothetical protein
VAPGGSHEAVADDGVELAVLLVGLAQRLAIGPDEAVGEEHAQEGAHQRTADHAAQDLHGRVDRRHRLDHAQHGRDDAERRQRVGRRLDRGRPRVQLGVVLA